MTKTGPTDAAPGAATVDRLVDAAENAQAAFLAPSHLAIGAAPPPALLCALDRAAQVVADLDARRLSLRFEAGADSRVQAQVIDADGNVLRRLPVGQALELLNGRGSWRERGLGAGSQ